MKNRKRAIILDMDETLEHGIYQSRYGIGNELIMVLRPNLDELINKLRETKKQGVDIILCTTARELWVKRFLALKPEFRNLFDRILTRDNEEKWRNYSEETYPLEYKARSENINLEWLKPVTTFGYESVLFIDDNKMEGVRLQILFGITQGKLEKDVTYFSGFGFNGGRIAWNEILGYKKVSNLSKEFAQKLEEYLKTERNNPGCHMMCLVIDKFIAKEFKAGLTLVDEEYLEEDKRFSQKIILLQKELEELSKKLKLESKLANYSNSELKELLNTDKKYPYEGIEVEYLKEQ